jgi:D-methionine transport system ATP-binding protein
MASFGRITEVLCDFPNKHETICSFPLAAFVFILGPFLRTLAVGSMPTAAFL